MNKAVSTKSSIRLRGMILLAICVAANQALAQESSGIWFGLQGGMHLVHPTITDQGMLEGPASPPGIGLSLSPCGWFDVGKSFTVGASLGVSNEPVRAKGISDQNPFIGLPSSPYEVEERLTWADFSTSLFYKPIQREKYSILVGAGISVRYLLSTNSEIEIEGTPVTPTYNAEDYMYKWNYALPLSAGVSLPVGDGQQVMLLAGYQVGLRGIYEPASLSSYAWENGHYKVNTTTLRLIYVFKIR